MDFSPRIALASATLLVACTQQAQPMTPRLWATRGDEAAATDPARAVANYREALEKLSLEKGRARAPNVPVDPRPLEAGEVTPKLREAAARWLNADATAYANKLPSAPEEVLTYARGLRSKASALGVDTEVGPAIATIEAAGADAYWRARLAEADAQGRLPYEATLWLGAVKRALPQSARGVLAAADAELAQRRQSLVNQYTARFKAAAGHPAAQTVRSRLLAAVMATPGTPTFTAWPIFAGDRARIGWEPVAADGCDGVAAATQNLKLASRAGHTGTLRLPLSCTSNQVTTQRTGSEVQTKTRQETRTSSKTVCANATQYDWVPSTNSAGKPTTTYGSHTVERCSSVPVTETVDVEYQVIVPLPVQVRELSAAITGTATVTVDGVAREVPFNLKETRTEEQYRGLRTHSEFSGATPNDVLRSLLYVRLPAEVKALAASAEQELQAAMLKAAEKSLREGDDVGADDVLAAVLAAQPTTAVPTSLAPQGPMSAATYAGLLGGQVPAFDVSLASVGPDGPKFALPDREGTLQQLADFRAQREAEELADDRTRGDTPLWGYGLSLNQWQRYEGDGMVGLGARLDRRGAGGSGLPFWFYDGSLATELNFSLGLGLDATVRTGLGVRTPHVWVAPYLAGGASGRGFSDGPSLYVPFGLDAGFGARFVGAVGSGRIEFFAERLSRPFHGAGSAPLPILQKFRYELRAGAHYGSSYWGLLTACSFHQESANDYVLPLSGSKARNCDLAFLHSF